MTHQLFRRVRTPDQPLEPSRLRVSFSLFIPLLLLLGSCPSCLLAQTLARPGWAGSGLTVERWWKHAVILDLPNAAAIPTPDGLDTMRSLGVEAILLRSLAPAIAPTPPDSSNSIDDLLREGSRRGIRVLIELPTDQPAAEVTAAARSWAARGAAGFLVDTGTPDILRTVRSAIHLIPGERILISTSAAGSPASAPPDRQAPPNTTADLQLVPIAGLSPPPDATELRVTPDAARMRTVLATLPSTPLITTANDPAPKTVAALKLPADLERVHAAAVLLLAPGASLIPERWLSSGYGPSFAADPSAAATAADDHSALYQLREFAALHHDRPAFRDGPTTLLDHTSEGAAVWLRRGPAGSTFVVACNLRSNPLRLSLTDDLARLHLRGTFLRTLSRSDPGLGAMPLNAVTLPPFGVYIGELSR